MTESAVCASDVRFAAPHSTNKERDTESGLDYFGARYYASSMGRFMSPDPSGLVFADPTNPQSFNLYSYVLNNPLKFVDPSGMAKACHWSGNDWDNTPEDGGASPQDCKDQGGTFEEVPGPVTTVTVRPDGNSGCSGFCVDIIGVAGAMPLPAAPQVDPDTQRIQQLAIAIARDTKPIQCAEDALGKNGVALLLDGAGFIPGESQAMAGVQIVIATVSTVNSLGHNDQKGAVAGVVGGSLAATQMASKGYAMAGAKAIPFVGMGVNVLATGHDLLSGVGPDYKACVSRPQ